MKNIFLLLFLLGAFSTLAQKHELVLGTSFLENGIILSTGEVSYFHSVNANNSLGLRFLIRKDNRVTFPNDEKSWQFDLMNKRTIDFKGPLSSFIETGVSYLQKEEEIFLPVFTFDSYINTKEIKVNYFGFLLGFTLEAPLNSKIKLGLNYRTYFYLTNNDDTDEKRLVISHPNLIASYLF